MRWLGGRESTNVEDRRGTGGGGFPMRVGGGLGAIIIVVIGLFLGIDPSTLMALLDGVTPEQTTLSDGRSRTWHIAAAASGRR
jgi:predicted metalloprotease